MPMGVEIFIESYINCNSVSLLDDDIQMTIQIICDLIFFRMV